MPRASGSRTGKKHKRSREQVAADAGDAEAARRIATLKAAAAAADSALAQSQPQNAPVDDVVREWLDDLLYQVEDVVDDECRMHEQYQGAALACAEAVKRRTFGSSLAWHQGGEAQWLRVRGFFAALQKKQSTSGLVNILVTSAACAIGTLPGVIVVRHAASAGLLCRDVHG